MSIPRWTSIDSQSELDAFGASICWDDTQFVESYVTPFSLPDFPSEINRSGQAAQNVFLLLDVCGGEDDWLEIAFVEADWFQGSFLYQPHMYGRVDSLMRVELTSQAGKHRSTDMRCSRLLYRFRNCSGLLPGPVFSQWFADLTSSQN